MRVYVIGAVAAVVVVIGFVVDTWELESPISLPDVPGWFGPLALVVCLVETFRRDRARFRHLVLTLMAVAVMFGAGLALVAAATL